MTLSYVTITGSFLDGSDQPLTGEAVFTPSQSVYAGGVPQVTPDNPVTAQIVDGQLQSMSGGALELLATDNSGLTYLSLTGFFYWTVQVTLAGVTQAPWSFGLPSSPDSVDLYSLANTAYSGGGGGAVASVFGRTGAVTAQSGDYAVAQVTGAAPLASPALTGNPTAPTQTTGDSSTKIATDAFVATAVGVETSRAEAAEALLAAKASPALTGTPTAPTAAALTDSTQIATTAYTDSAVAVETARAETAEGLAALKANNLSDLANEATARSNLGLGSAATQASSAFDAAGAAATAQSNAEAFASGLQPTSGSPLPSSVGGTGLSESTAALLLAALLAAGGGAMGAELAPKVVALSDGSTIAVNAALGNDFRVQLGGSHTFGAPTNPADGQRITIHVQQPVSGGPYTPSFASGTGGYDFGAAGAPTWSTAASAIDVAGFLYRADVNKWLFTGAALGN